MCLRVEIKGPRTRVPHKAPWAPRTLQAWTLEGSIRPACPSHFQSFHSESQVPGSTLMGSKGHRHRGPARWGTPLPPRPHLSEDRPDQRGQALGPRLPLDWLCRLQRHRRQVSQEEHGVQGCPIPPPACSWPPGGPPPPPNAAFRSVSAPKPCAPGTREAQRPDLLRAVQGRPLVQLAVRARPDGGGEGPDGALLSILGICVAGGEGGVTKALGPSAAPPPPPPVPAQSGPPPQLRGRAGPYMSESSELDSSPWPSDLQRL